ncbi:MAG: hypothetical protein ABJN26_17705 [Stappiaceae bacterium]
MAHSDNSVTGLFKNLGLALLNATLVLVIVAALSAGWAAYSIKDLAKNTAREMSTAAIEAADLDPQSLVAELRVLSSEIKSLRAAISQGVNDDKARSSLSSRLDKLEQQIGLLTNPQEWALSDALVDKITANLSLILKDWRDCNPLDSSKSAALHAVHILN